MNNNIVSIIVPIYNVAQYLDECISTIVHQTYQALQIILVDDGSPDNCPKKCDEWAKRDARIEVIHKRNGGLSDARNAGLRKATGKYVFFVDPDDLVNIKAIEVLVNAMNKYDVDLVVCRYANLLADHYRVVASPSFNASAKIINRKTYLSLILEDKMLTNHVWRRLHKRANIPVDVFPKGQNFEDIYATPALAKHCSKILLLNFVGYYYRENVNGIVHRLSYKQCKDNFASLKHGAKEIAKLEPSLQNKAYASDILHDVFVLNSLTQIKDKRVNYLRRRIIAHINKQKKRANYLVKYLRDAAPEVKLGIKDPWLIDKSWARLICSWSIRDRHRRKDLKNRHKQALVLHHEFKQRAFKKNFVILSTPDYGNLGDQAQRLGEYFFLAKYLKDYEPIEITNNNLANTDLLKKYLHSSDYVSLQAGGNIGTLYPGIHEAQEGALAKFKNNKLLIFPQTFYYSRDSAGKQTLNKTEKLYDQCQNLHVFVRERSSLAFVKHNMPEVKTDLVPDMSLMLDYQGNYPRQGALLLLRLDSEKTLTWRDEDRIFSAVEKKFGSRVTQSDTHIYMDKLPMEDYEDALLAKLKQIASSQLVITDRLHGMIFAAITRTPCVLLPSKSPKIQGVYQWVKQNKYVKFINNLTDLPTAIDEVLAADNSVFDRGIIDQEFTEMARIIKKM